MSVYIVMHAQGLVHLMGGAQVIAEAVHQHGIILAAYGPYSAAGASETLNCPVNCVSKSFVTFDGLVLALDQPFS